MIELNTKRIVTAGLSIAMAATLLFSPTAYNAETESVRAATDDELTQMRTDAGSYNSQQEPEYASTNHGIKFYRTSHRTVKESEDGTISIVNDPKITFYDTSKTLSTNISNEDTVAALPDEYQEAGITINKAKNIAYQYLMDEYGLYAVAFLLSNGDSGHNEPVYIELDTHGKASTICLSAKGLYELFEREEVLEDIVLDDLPDYVSDGMTKAEAVDGVVEYVSDTLDYTYSRYGSDSSIIGTCLETGEAGYTDFSAAFCFCSWLVPFGEDGTVDWDGGETGVLKARYAECEDHTYNRIKIGDEMKNIDTCWYDNTENDFWLDMGETELNDYDHEPLLRVWF